MARLTPGQHIHLVGIGGAGLSAIARVLLGLGYRVSGSDRSANALTEALAQVGAQIFNGHDPSYIAGADALIVTSAVSADHVEVAAARAAGIPVYKRQDIIAELMAGRQVIAVAGTHGKTTTTSLVAHLLQGCGGNPGYIVGGVMGNTGLNAAVGSGAPFVIEADEYDNMFHGVRPDVAVVTNIEYDHPDFFPSPAALLAAFRTFVEQLDETGGTLVACADDAGARQLAAERRAAGGQVVTYGLAADADWRLVAWQPEPGDGSAFEALAPDGQRACGRLPLPGAHNVINALGALAAVQAAGAADWSCALAGLATFKPTGRRFDLRAEVGGVAVIDDYAHHPTAIRATLAAARSRYPGRAIWAVWQPHTYTRTRALLDEYRRAFADADHVLVTDIYAAREQPLPGVTSADLVAGMPHPDARHLPTFDAVVQALAAGVRPPAAVIIMSAGDAPQIGIDFVRLLEQQA